MHQSHVVQRQQIIVGLHDQEDQKLTYSVNVITHLDGAYIENTNGDLFSASSWPTKGTGQVNSIVVIDGSWKRRIYVDDTYTMGKISRSTGFEVPGISAATSSGDGEYNTNIIAPLVDGEAIAMTAFTVGGNTYLPAYEELMTIMNYKNQIDECRVAIGKQPTPNNVINWWSSTYWGTKYDTEDRITHTYLWCANQKGGKIRGNEEYTWRIGKYN